MLPLNPTDEVLLHAVESWIADLEAGDFQGALNRTVLDPYYAWTPELLKQTIEGYGPGKPTRGDRNTVTSSLSALGRRYAKIDRDCVSPTAVAFIEHSLPLDGQWSDLVAQFRVVQQDSASALILEQVLVP